MIHDTQNNEVIIGIDVAKDKLDIYLLPINEHFIIKNNQKEISKFIRNFLKMYSVTQVKVCVMEATGGYEQKVAKLLVAASFPIHIAHPNQVFHFGKSKKLFAKTDKIDTRTLALFGYENDLILTALPSKASQELKEMSNRKMQLKEILTIEKCRLKDHLTEKLRKSITRFIKQIDREIEIVAQKIKELIEADDQKKKQAAILQTLKGIGEATAHMLVATLPELGHLSRSQITALTGLAPKNKDSGTKCGYRAIQGGRFYVRKALYMPALSALRFNEVYKNFYKMLRSKGKKPKVAIVAVMRKMIITMNAMLKNNESWIPTFSNTYC